ncbi:hypothetical protein LBMAG42_18480 [Deltaproteobacteria bacterium]|nr:hypothetical protein LBMAG42_18480 [Deltaproteobacteria bacterium]
MSVLVWLTMACAVDEVPGSAPAALHFVRGGVLDAAGHLVEMEWKPGESVTVAGVTTVAPKLAECVALGSVPLGDMSRMVVAGAPAPDTDLAFSPDGSRLAIGSFGGEVVVVDVATRAVVARRQLAEAMVRRVAWSEDGATLYAGEQSPDATLHALDSGTLVDRWTVDLADRVGHSALPAGEDLYGVYTLPGIYGLDVLPGGDLLVAAAHGWTDASGTRANRSQVVRFGADGSLRAAWPDEPGDMVILHPEVDVPGKRIAVPVTRSASGPDPAGLPIGGLQLLALDSLAPAGSLVVSPLTPWFTTTYVWQAQDVDVAHDTVMLGLGDGRVVFGGLDGTVRITLAGGSPVLAGDVPIAASVGHGFLREDEAVYLTSGTNIPWGAAAPDLRPPTAHPNENGLWVVGLDGTPRWSFHGPWAVQGLTLAPDGRTLVVGAGERMTDNRRDLYGALIFDLGGEARGGEARLLATCSTEGPVFFRQAVSVEGVIALAESPYPTGDGGVAGAYRVGLFR